jgi:hypothetical protein
MKLLPGLLLAILAQPALAAEAVTAPAAYVPGVGDMMSAIQARHAKIWFAYQAANWALVDYEIDELEEGFADIRAWHPSFKKVSRPLPELFAVFVDAPVAALRKAAGGRNKAAFEHAYDGVTAGCNECHVATAFGFNRVVRPGKGPFPNQDFRAPR